MLKTLSTRELGPDILKALYEYEAFHNQRVSEEESEVDQGFLEVLMRKIQSFHDKRDGVPDEMDSETELYTKKHGIQLNKDLYAVRKREAIRDFFLKEQAHDLLTDSVYYFGNIRAPFLFLIGIQDKIAISPAVITAFYEIQRDNPGVPSVSKSFDYSSHYVYVSAL